MIRTHALALVSSLAATVLLSGCSTTGVTSPPASPAVSFARVHELVAGQEDGGLLVGSREGRYRLLLDSDGSTTAVGPSGGLDFDPMGQGERARPRIENTTQMWHPFHLHGHTYQHSGAGPRKDTSIVLPGTSLTVEFNADNPGLWAAHCHNIHHAEARMMTLLGYQAA